MVAWHKNPGFWGPKTNVFQLSFRVCFVTVTNEKAPVYAKQGSGNGVFCVQKMQTHITKYKT